jgi:uncharacterized membrane protein
MAKSPEDDVGQIASRWLSRTLPSLGDAERKILQRAADRHPIAKNPNLAFDATQTFGERLADKVATFGGSWTFIIIFGVVLVLWTLGNILLGKAAFDAYPFIFLNLMLSMLAAIQAPIIMMSQNRQSSKDRADAGHDYEVNLKAEIEIMALHEKIDRMRTQQLEELLKSQQQQIDLLTRIIGLDSPVAKARSKPMPKPKPAT